MKLENLVPLNKVSDDKFRELFNKNSDLAWNLRNYAESSEGDYAREVLETITEDKSAWVSWEYGIYTKCHFSARHDPKTLVAMAVGCLKIQMSYGFFNETTDPALIEALAIAAKTYEVCSPDEEDSVLDAAYLAMDAVSSAITDCLKEIFEHWESDENVLKEMKEPFLECYGDRLFLDPTDDSIVELTMLKQWDFN